MSTTVELTRVKDEAAALQAGVETLEAEATRMRRAGGGIYTRDFVAGVAYALEVVRGGDR